MSLCECDTQEVVKDKGGEPDKIEERKVRNRLYDEIMEASKENCEHGIPWN